MGDNKLQPYADLKYKAREYEDKETGKMKGVWVTVGTLFTTPHGSHMSIKMDSMPVGEWNGWLSVFKRDEAEDIKSKSETHEFNKKVHDVLPDDNNITVSEIPF